MVIEIGSKVRFLNEVGGGEVIKKIDKLRWLVRTPDGFDIPMLASELVVDAPPEVVELVNKGEQPPSIRQMVASQSLPNRTIGEAKTTQQPVSQSQVQIPLEAPRLGVEGLYLGFAPADPQDILRGPYTLYVINEAQDDLFLTLSRLEQTKSITFFGGRVAKLSCRRVAEIKNKELFLYESLHLQGLYYSLGEHPLRPTLEADITINGNEFKRPRSFRENRFLDEELLLIAIRDEAREHELELLVEKKSQDIEKVKAPTPEPPRGVPAPEQVEIDLHLEALTNVKNNKMTPTEALQFQLQHFRRAMDDALRTPHIKRLVAIHGVGNGTLGREVQRVLRMDYKQCQYQDASFKEYGYGATLVILVRK